MDDKDLRSQLEGLFSDLHELAAAELPAPVESQPAEMQADVFRALADNATDGIAIGNAEGRVTYVNRACSASLAMTMNRAK